MHMRKQQGGRSRRVTFGLSLLAPLIILAVPAIVRAAYAPPARLTFTFDDVADRVYDNARPSFEAHGLPAVVYAETLYLGNEDWTMTWEEMNDLEDRLGWEIGSHSITHPDLRTVSNTKLNHELTQSKRTLEEHGLSITSFATPYGAYDERVLKAISKYYTSHRAAWGGPNIWPDIYNDYELIVLEASHNIAPETVMGWIDEAAANGQWLILLLHDVVDGVPAEYEYNKDDLRKIVDHAAASPIKVVTMTEGLALAQGANLIPNWSFDAVTNGFAADWTRNHATAVTVNTANYGNAPSYKNSLRLVGATAERSAETGPIAIAYHSYLFRMFANIAKYTKGGVGVFISEFDQTGSYLGGQWLGGERGRFIGTRYYAYEPSGANVATIKLKIYSEAGSSLTAYFDSIEFRALDGAVTPPPPPPPPPASESLVANGSFEDPAGDFAASWTRNNPTAVTIDASGQGYAPAPLHALRIIGSGTQNTAVSAQVALGTSQSFEISYFAKTVGYAGGGTALWVNEYDAGGQWLKGQWLGGYYRTLNEVLKYSYTPSSAAVKTIDIHLFTEAGSTMTLYIDEVAMRSK